MKILALDPAKVTGVAIYDRATQQITTSRVDLSCKGKDLGQQHVTLIGVLESLLTAHSCDLIAAENAGFGSVNRATQAMHDERLGVIRMVAAMHKIELVTFQPSKIKAYATGSGNAKKEQMQRAAQSLLKLGNLTHDEADAAWIAHLAAHERHWR